MAVKRITKLCRHKSKDLAYATINGREKYFRKWGTLTVQIA